MTSPMPGRGIRTLEEVTDKPCPEYDGTGALPEYVATNAFWKGLEMSGREEICWACQGTGKRREKETGDG